MTLGTGHIEPAGQRTQPTRPWAHEERAQFRRSEAVVAQRHVQVCPGAGAEDIGDELVFGREGIPTEEEAERPPGALGPCEDKTEQVSGDLLGRDRPGDEPFAQGRKGMRHDRATILSAHLGHALS